MTGCIESRERGYETCLSGLRSPTTGWTMDLLLQSRTRYNRVSTPRNREPLPRPPNPAFHRPQAANSLTFPAPSLPTPTPPKSTKRC